MKSWSSIKVPLSEKGIDTLLKEIDKYKSWQEKQTQVLLDTLAQRGALNASVRFSRAIYTGLNDVTVTAEPIAKGYVVKAEGEAVLFIEFGSGITYGSGHPEAGTHGMGPGTYPNGKGHWDDPRGWYIPKSKGGGHTFGNPPAMAMYDAVKSLEADLPALVKAVFSR